MGRTSAACPYVRALMAYLRHCIARLSARSVHAYHHVLVKCLSAPAIRAALECADEDLLVIAADHFRERFAKVTFLDHLATLRRWYIHCANRCQLGFDADVAIALEALVVGNARIATAVNGADPDAGPLSPRESAAWKAAIWTAVDRRSLPVPVLAAVLLNTVFGVNPENLRRLDEGHLSIGPGKDGARTLSMPRIKKGTGDKVADWVDRSLTSAVAAVLDLLIAENRRHYPPDAGDSVHGRPLFRNARPQDDLASGRSVGPNWFYRAVKVAQRHFELLDDRGEPLIVFPRRLRYTFATEQVAAGATPDELMALLDHSSTAVLLVYYRASLEVVPRLDRAVGARLAPFARIALGLPPPPPLPPFSPALEEAPLRCFACRTFIPTASRLITEEADRLEELVRARRVIGDGRDDRALAESLRRIAGARNACAALGRIGR